MKTYVPACPCPSITRCGHKKAVGASVCIRGLVGEKNSQHFIVATQDYELRWGRDSSWRDGQETGPMAWREGVLRGRLRGAILYLMMKPNSSG